MEVVEYEPDRTLGMLIRDGPVEMRSRMTFEPQDQAATLITGILDVPSMEEPMDPGPIQQSLRRMKELIESEVPD